MGPVPLVLECEAVSDYPSHMSAAASPSSASGRQSTLAGQPSGTKSHASRQVRGPAPVLARPDDIDTLEETLEILSNPSVLADRAGKGRALESDLPFAESRLPRR